MLTGFRCHQVHNVIYAQTASGHKLAKPLARGTLLEEIMIQPSYNVARSRYFSIYILLLAPHTVYIIYDACIPSDSSYIPTSEICCLPNILISFRALQSPGLEKPMDLDVSFFRVTEKNLYNVPFGTCRTQRRIAQYIPERL